jgi:hypothetical protein
MIAESLSSKEIACRLELAAKPSTITAQAQAEA